MLRKRLIGVLTIRGGVVVQSFAYSNYLPVGRAEYQVENLERWGVDEILILAIDRALDGPDLGLIARIADLGLSTPVIYGGGIKSVKDAAEVIRRGADRIVVDSLIHDKPKDVAKISDLVGAQALIVSVPLEYCNNEIVWFDYRTRKKNILTPDLQEFVSPEIVSEVMIIDHKHNGVTGEFDERLLMGASLEATQIIAYGGVGTIDQVERLFKKRQVAAVGLGNHLLYKEHSVQSYKKSLMDRFTRSPKYSKCGL